MLFYSSQNEYFRTDTILNNTNILSRNRPFYSCVLCYLAFVSEAGVDFVLIEISPLSQWIATN